MKIVTGYIFTDSAVQDLRNAGFRTSGDDDARTLDRTIDSGYRDFDFPLSSEGLGWSFRLREVIDEESYFLHRATKNFSPFVEEVALSYQMTHLNSVTHMMALLDKNMDEGELKDFLQIRKHYPIWAIHLKCADFTKFRSISGLKFFQFAGAPAAVIHLSTSCFDIVIS